MSTTSLLTFAEFEQLPDAPGKQELIDGELIELPPPEIGHSRISKRYCFTLLTQLGESRVWFETGYRIAGGWLQPDVSVTWPDQPMLGRYLSGGPMLAVEILSPSNTAADIQRKINLYLSEGGGEVWVVDGKRRTMTVYRKAGDHISCVVVDSTYTSDLLGITIDLTRIFG